MLKTAATSLLLGLCAACGSYKAVRPDVPLPVVAEAQNYTVRYQAADGQRIEAVYVNSNSPMTVELRQGNTVEKLTQTHSMTKSTEYGNLNTKWQVQDGFATLTRNSKTIVFTEIIE